MRLWAKNSVGGIVAVPSALWRSAVERWRKPTLNWRKRSPARRRRHKLSQSGGLIAPARQPGLIAAPCKR